MNDETLRYDCPKCGRVRYYSNIYKLYRSKQLQSICRYHPKIHSEETRRKLSELLSGENNGFFGKRHTEETKRKISMANKGKPHPCSEESKKKISKANKGRKHTEESKWLMSLKQKGKIFSDNHKLRLSISAKNRKTQFSQPGEKNGMYGKHQSEDAKRRIRIGIYSNIKKKGYPPSVDEGAVEWFEMTKDFGYTFQPNWHCKMLGYIADGYDKDRHIWMEYDSPYHRYKCQRKKDMVRQTNIINHFESIGNPLNQFVRVDVTQWPKRIGIAVVYRGNKSTNKVEV